MRKGITLTLTAEVGGTFLGSPEPTKTLSTDKTDSCGPNDVFQRGYSLDWDGPVSLGSVNSGPVPTGRALTHETSIT